MIALIRRPRPFLPLAALVAVVLIGIASQMHAIGPGGALPAGVDEPLLDQGAGQGDAGAGSADGGDPAVELQRIHDDVTFWAERLQRRPRDIVSAVKLAETSIEHARATGDVTAYLRAEAAAAAALKAQPDYKPALATRATILVALHRFPEARAIAKTLLRDDPQDLVALGVLGDASLEVGDLATARQAYETLSLIGDSAASRIRRMRLAYVEGDTTNAIESARSAVAGAIDDGIEGSGLAFYHAALGDLLAATGHADEARSAYQDALNARPGWPAALAGIGRLDAGRGDLDGAIRSYDQAIATIPLPESLARRGDLLMLRAGQGDAAKATDDYATVEAIAKLAGDAANVYDRTLALYLADHHLDTSRALGLAESELKVRKDVFGYDAYAWALLAAGRPADAQQAMDQARAFGTVDARLLYHAGMIALANDRRDDARTLLRQALDLEPGFDPFGASRARQALASLS